MIIAKYDAILDQSERVQLDNHLSKDTDLNHQGDIWDSEIFEIPWQKYLGQG